VKPRLILATAFLLISNVSFAWPALPKIIASGKGMQIIKDKLPVTFLWIVGISLSAENNVYVLLPIHSTRLDRNKFESSGIDVVLHDNESIFLKVVTKTDKMDSHQITYAVAKKLVLADPRLIFFLDKSTLYNPRP
jgi:hypothetical protein